MAKMHTAYNVQQHVAIGITSGLLALTTLIVYLRLHIRCVLPSAGPTGWDDLTVFIAWIMAVGASIATYFGVLSGLGRRIEELQPEQVYSLDLSSLTATQFYNVGISAVEISFLVQFYRLFPDRTTRRACVCLGVFCFLWMFAQAVLYALSCLPVAGLVSAMAAVCVPTLPAWTAIASINAFSHLLIFFIPMKPLWGTPLLKHERHFLIGIFCVGFIVCVISIIRIPILRHGAASPDPAFANVATTLWSLAELDTAILCASLPVLRPLAARFIRGITPADPSSPRKAEQQPETGERVHLQHHAPTHSWSSKPAGAELLVLQGVSGRGAPLRGTRLDDAHDGSTPESGGSRGRGRSFLRWLVSERRDRHRYRDRGVRGVEEEAEEHMRSRAVPTTTVVEVDDVPGACSDVQERPLDGPVGTYNKKSPLVQKPVPRAPLTFYPRDATAKRPPVPIIQPMSPRRGGRPGGQDSRLLPHDKDPIITRPDSPRRRSHVHGQQQLERQLRAPMTAAPNNTPPYYHHSGDRTGRLSHALLMPPPLFDSRSSSSSSTGTLLLASTPSPSAKNNNNTTTTTTTRSHRHHHHHHHTLPPPPPPCPDHPTARQICSRCALNRRPLPPTPAEEAETQARRRQASLQPTTTTTTTTTARRVWVARSSSTHAMATAAAQAQAQVQAQMQMQMQTGEVVGGRGVHLVDVVEGDKPRSWRGQMALATPPPPPVEEEKEEGEEGNETGRRGSAEHHYRHSTLGPDREGAAAAARSGEKEEEEVGGGLGRGRRQGRGRDVSGMTGPRRSESGSRRGAGTSWLRLSTG